MENKELHEILFLLDSDRGRTTKIRILNLLKQREVNANEISSLLGIKSYSHTNKFLNILYELFLIDYIEESFSNEYKIYVKKKWYLTKLGNELVESLKNVSLLREITPKMFHEKLKRQIKNSKEYKEWRNEILIRDNSKCKICKICGETIQAHHIIELNKIIKDNNINSLKQALECKELFDIKNGECLCSLHHIEKHNNKMVNNIRKKEVKL